MLISYRIKKSLKDSYKYDMKRYLKYSGPFSTTISSTNLISNIIREYHVIEKGLTMPETRLGFGKDIIMALSNDCIKYINKYGQDEEQLHHAIGVVMEYEQLHREKGFELNEEIKHAIWNLKHTVNNDTVCTQKSFDKGDYFQYSESSFQLFSASRSSVRNFSSENIPYERIIEALEIARTTPSACNRQCWRTYLFTEKDKIANILDVQGGNRGFGHLGNKLIVISAEIGVFYGKDERNEAFIDGGMYAMNLLYALHYKQIAACILNCSNNIEKDKRLRDLCEIKDSEVFIAMIVCGIPPDKFKVANSKRYRIEMTNTIN